ncbi:hypothetical protein [Burkholderia sp. MBR-1]|uniref:hypothetical protein n=1 Tax=Burkholderia sp. MBR-1 TaxID=2732364 RepID=UPI0015EE5406|nr:hypothetical protein [Burkholderia sp. MBR-1]QMI49793.1 hypothetical protein MBR110_30450 [Burkholderia sp. MBR-1]
MNVNVLKARRAFAGVFATSASFPAPSAAMLRASRTPGESVAFEVNGFITVVHTIADRNSSPLYEDDVQQFVTEFNPYGKYRVGLDVKLGDAFGKTWMFDRQAAVLQELESDTLKEVAAVFGNGTARRHANQRVLRRVQRVKDWMARRWAYLTIQVQVLDGFGCPMKVESMTGIASDARTEEIGSAVEELVEACFVEPVQAIRPVQFF